MKTVNLTIAGTCTGDSGRGGWAFVLRMGEHSIERTGGSPLTTKAQMELNAVTESLKALRERCQVYLFSDNRRLLDGIDHWREVWRRTLFTRVSEHLPHPPPMANCGRSLMRSLICIRSRIGASSDRLVIQIRSDAKSWLNRKPSSMQVFRASAALPARLHS
jgi:hypothetical protein